MKTTGGKTKTAKPERKVRIMGQNGKQVAVGKGTSLRNGLENYHNQVLAPRGWADPIFNGNVMTVYDHMLNMHVFRAYEVK